MRLLRALTNWKGWGAQWPVIHRPRVIFFKQLGHVKDTRVKVVVSERIHVEAKWWGTQLQSQKEVSVGKRECGSDKVEEATTCLLPGGSRGVCTAGQDEWGLREEYEPESRTAGRTYQATGTVKSPVNIARDSPAYEREFTSVLSFPFPCNLFITRLCRDL